MCPVTARQSCPENSSSSEKDPAVSAQYLLEELVKWAGRTVDSRGSLYLRWISSNRPSLETFVVNARTRADACRGSPQRLARGSVLHKGGVE